MGKRQVALMQFLEESGLISAQRTPPRPSSTSVRAAGLVDVVADVYRILGGQHQTPRIAPGGWDVVVRSGVVELDEERHFNRYRDLMLASPIYGSPIGFDVMGYAGYCARYEPQCMKSASHGGYWTSSPSEKEFGLSAPQGDLSGTGSARWKQRAFYDFIKDLSPLIDPDLRVVRFSIWDDVEADDGPRRLGWLLDDLAAGRFDARRSAALLGFVDKRLAR